MNKIDLIIDALSVAQNSVWSALNQEALAYAIELKLELAKPVAWGAKSIYGELEGLSFEKQLRFDIPLYALDEVKHD